MAQRRANSPGSGAVPAAVSAPFRRGSASAAYERKKRTQFSGTMAAPRRISPVRGSDWLGPTAVAPGPSIANQRTASSRVPSSVDQSASSACCSTRMASWKPARSKALFHSRMPARTGARHFSGMLRSITTRIGCFGGDTAADGSCFSSRQREMMCVRRSLLMSLPKSRYESVKKPTRWSALRGCIGCAGSGAIVTVKLRNRLRASGTTAGGLGSAAGLGGGAPGASTGGAGSLGTAKCERSVSAVPSAVLRVPVIDEFARSSA